MSAPAGKAQPTPASAWPTDTYFDEFHKLLPDISTARR